MRRRTSSACNNLFILQRSANCLAAQLGWAHAFKEIEKHIEKNNKQAELSWVLIEMSGIVFGSGQWRASVYNIFWGQSYILSKYNKTEE